jgi:phosphatidylserine decarboxylase
MTTSSPPRSFFARLGAQEDINFLLTNRIPRRLATRLVGWLSRIEHPWAVRPMMAVWRTFSGIDLSDAAETRFSSLHACFTRALKPGARSFAAAVDMLCSPCDAIVGTHGVIAAGQLHQIKGFPYALENLLGSVEDAAAMEGGTYVTLRLTAGMYHRFHAPHDLTVEQVDYISGDCWNVNPIALKRIERLFCRNERAAISARLAPGGQRIVLVAVAAILVASIRLTFLDTVAALRSGGTRRMPVNAKLERGEEMGWFEHGSTIVMLAPPGAMPAVGIFEGIRVMAGQALLRLPAVSGS